MIFLGSDDFKNLTENLGVGPELRFLRQDIVPDPTSLNRLREPDTGWILYLMMEVLQFESYCPKLFLLLLL